MGQLLFVSYNSLITMANFFFYRYHFVQLDEPDLFSEAEEGVTDFDECYNPRFIEDVAMNAVGIGKKTSVMIFI